MSIYFIGGVDFSSGPYTVTFPARMTQVSLDVPLTDDNILEGDETFLLVFASLPNGVTDSNPFYAEVTIVDDDGIYIN